MTQKIKEQWAVLILLFIVPVFHVWIGTENSYIADSALKAMQTDSLIQSGFRTEELRYPAQELDPHHEAFFLPGFAKEIRGKFIGQYPIAFSFFSSLFRLGGDNLEMDADVIVFFYDPFPLSSFKKKTHKSKDGFTRLRSHDSFRFKLGFQRILDLFSFQLSRFFLVAPLSGIKKVPISLLRFNRMFDFDLVATGVVAFFRKFSTF